LVDFDTFWGTVTVDKIVAMTRFNKCIHDFCTYKGIDEDDAVVRKFIYLRCCNLVRLNKLVVGRFNTEKLCKHAYDGLLTERKKVMLNYISRHTDAMSYDEKMDFAAFDNYFHEVLCRYLNKIETESPEMYEI
jgi:hypothetical protein